jgi:hypothetical protein
MESASPWRVQRHNSAAAAYCFIAAVARSLSLAGWQAMVALSRVRWNQYSWRNSPNATRIGCVGGVYVRVQLRPCCCCDAFALGHPHRRRHPIPAFTDSETSYHIPPPAVLYWPRNVFYFSDDSRIRLRRVFLCLHGGVNCFENFAGWHPTLTAPSLSPYPSCTVKYSERRLSDISQLFRPAPPRLPRLSR